MIRAVTSHMKRETTRAMGAVTRLFIRIRHFFHDVGQKTNSIIKSFSKETRKQIYLSKLVNILNFCNEKVTLIVFHIKIQ